MEGTIAEVRLFAANFSPRSWAYCWGQTVGITQNTALYSLLGTTYGGDGRQTFKLPDLSGRVAIGVGQGQGLTLRDLGEAGGKASVGLIVNEMPAHVHPVVGNPTLSVTNSVADKPAPDGNVSLAATQLANGTPLNSYVAASPNISLHTDTVKMSLAITSGSIIGGNQPHNNIQPSLGLAYIICLTGAFPQRP